MGENELRPFNKYAQQRIEALRRQRQLLEWLSGEGALTDTETELVNRFGGQAAKIYAREALSLHRKNKLRQILNGETELTDKERELFSQFTGDAAPHFAKYVIQLHREGMLDRFLGGTDFDSTLNVLSSGKPTDINNL